MDEQNCKASVVDAAKKLLSENLVARTWGNVSCRIDENRFAVTPSGLSYDKTTESDIVVYDMKTGKSAGAHKPSSEKGVHAAAYEIYPDVNFVIHTHQTYATAFSLCGFDKMDITEEEKTALGGIAIAEYALPGTKKLAAKAAECFKTGAHTVLLANHGAVTVGTNADEALKRARLLEKICERNCEECPASDKTDKAKSDEILLKIKEKYSFTAVCSDAAVLTVANRAEKSFSAELDDAAQMIGVKIYRCGKISDAEKLLKKYCVVLISDVGAVVRADTQSDCDALCSLIKKACVCRLHTLSCGADAKLAAFDAKLMRFVYKTKYSKQIDETVRKNRKKEAARAVKFTLFSCSAGIIQLLSFTLLNEVIFHGTLKWISYLIALILSVIWNFTFNRRFTFKSANNVPLAMLEVVGYYALFTPLSTKLFDYLTVALLWNEYLVEVINMVLNFVTEFLFDRFVVFNETIDTNDIAKKEKIRKGEISENEFTENGETKSKENNKLANLSLIFGALGGIGGLILGIIGLCKYKEFENIRKCAVGISFFVSWTIILLILLL